MFRRKCFGGEDALLYPPFQTYRFHAMRRPDSYDLNRGRGFRAVTTARGLREGNNAGFFLIDPIDPGKLKEPHGESPDRRLAFRDVEREFLQLQVANRSLAGLIGQATKNDYASIRKEAAKINQSASRLKDSLLLPKSDDAGKRKKATGPLSPDELRSAVASLDTLVHGFVWNPFFRNLAVVDSEKFHTGQPRPRRNHQFERADS